MKFTATANSLIYVLEKLRLATCPEEAFLTKNLSSKDETLHAVQVEYRKLSKIAHPDIPANKRMQTEATEAFQLLSAFWEEAKLKIEEGIYGWKNAKPAKSSQPITFKTRKNTYILTERIKEGNTCGIFAGIATDKKSAIHNIIARIPHSPDDNDLMEREAKSLKAIYAKAQDLIDPTTKADNIAEMFLLRLPQMVESVKLDEPGTKEPRIINIFLRPNNLPTGWFTLEEIRAKHKDGVNTRVMIFIFNRILEGLTLSHSAKVVHGMLTPNHILIHAKEHLGNLVDWTASCSGTTNTLPYEVDSKYRAYISENVINGNPPTFADDIYTAAWSIIYLLGGDPDNQIIPNHIEKPIKDFLNKCVQPKAKSRPKNGTEAYREFQEVRKQVFGEKRHFIELNMD